MAKKLNRFVTYLILLNVIIFISGMLTYGEKYLFWEYPLSNLGGIKTVTGIPNTTSFLIFAIGMFSSSILCFCISFLFTGEHKRGKYKCYLFRICGIGYFIMIMPFDIVNIIHVIGAVTVFGALWLITVILLQESIHKIENYRILLYQLVLQVPVLPYAFLFFINSPLQVPVQKFAVSGLFLALKLIVTRYAKVT